MKIGDIIQAWLSLGDYLRFEDLSLLFVLGLLVNGVLFYQVFPFAKSFGQALATIWIFAFLPLLVKASRRRIQEGDEGGI